MGSRTNKSLWTLISGSVVQTNPQVLDSEIESSKELISQGLTYFKPNTDQTAKQYSAEKKSSGSIRNLVSKLAKLLGVSESICSEIFCSYLITEFRGTKESLKELLKEEQNMKPLLLDIWQFYRAERLYLLQIIKHILASKSDSGSPDYLCKAAKLLDSGQLTKLLLQQLTDVTKEKKPNTENLGSSLAKDCLSLWIHFNLREISELLQILLLSLNVTDHTKDDIISITDVFFEFGFGNKLSMKVEFDESNNQLVRSISYLCIMNLVYLLDLNTLTTSKEDHKIWESDDTVSKVERLISGLGNSPTHSPALLTWTLSCYLARGSEGLGKSTKMGEVAVANRVLRHLDNILLSDFMHHPVVADVIHMQVFSIVSVLLTVFDPDSMGMQTDLATLAVTLLRQQPAADQLWSQQPDTGVRLFVTELTQSFPTSMLTVLETLTSLASASELSCCNVVAFLASLNIYTEKVDGINIIIGENTDGTVQLLEERHPYQFSKCIYIPAGTRGELLENGFVRWKLPVNGWQVLLAECRELNMELSKGEEQIKPDRVQRVTMIGNLVASVINMCPDKVKALDNIMSELELICTRLCQSSHPPVNLMAAILQTFANYARALNSAARPLSVLTNTGLLPHYSMSHSLLIKEEATLDPGIVGHLLAGEETVSGEYPLLIAFLHFMKESCRSKDSLPGILLICREILPGLTNWRYQKPSDRELILKLCLQILQAFINNVKEGCGILSSEPGVSNCLLHLVSTGDRTIQTMLEAQVSWEKGRGTDFCEIIHYSLQILNSLLTSPASGTMLTGPVGAALRSPPSGQQPHLVLSLAHYTFFFHDPTLVTAAVNLLAGIARAAALAEESVSMLACLGNSAVSVKERLVNRLESSLEDIRLKIAIINLLSECIIAQPGMIQLLLDINIKIIAIQSSKEESKKDKDNPSQLIGEGCLEPALSLLELCRDREGDNWDNLHLALIKLIYRLWDSANLLATRHLKDTPDFWLNLCWPLYDPRDNPHTGHVELKAYILRILASEIYTWKGKVVPELSNVLEKICNEKSNSMKTWCTQKVTPSGDSSPNQKTVINESGDLEHIEPEDAELFLLSSWKIFLLILTKDHPSSFSPGVCNLIFTVTIKKLMSVLKEEPPPVRLTLLLAETGAVLCKRWQTKCTANMEDLCKDMSIILDTMCSAWSNIHPRSRVAIIGLAVSTLRCSQFKLDVNAEPGLLATWLPSIVRLLALSFRDAESQLAGGNETSLDVQIAELVLSLLQTVISRFTQDRSWLAELHHEASLQLLLAAASTCCKHKVAAGFVNKIFQLLLEVATSQSGTAALLTHELAQLLWLPLSDLPPSPQWHTVVLLGVEFATVLLRTGRTYALKTCITAIALLSEKLVADLVKLKSDITTLSACVTVTRFVALLSNHITIWKSDHRPSLMVMYSCCCALLHHCSALLMRPTYLGSLLKVSQGSGTEEDTARCRKMSTASVPDLELESVPPEAVTAHSQLLDISISCLSFLLSLSPPLSGLLTGDVMLDPGQWEPLLAISFANPTLEEVQEHSSYGTLLALANTCVRGLTRDHARSPSPARTGLTTPTMSRQTQLNLDTPEKRQLSLVLEKSVTLVLSQSIFTLSHSHLMSRDKQLLRREIGSELGSITDTWKRQFSRGGKSPAPSRSARSPAPLSSTPARGKSPQPPPSPQPGQRGKQDDQFMRFVGNLIGNVYK